jgi:hypothetical protein
MKKKKAQGPFYSQNLEFKGRKGNHWKMMWVQIGYHEPDLPLWEIAYWVSISRIFLKSFEQKSLKISLKIFKIFITLLCYGLHQKFVKNTSLSKKFKSIYKCFIV